MTDYPCDKFDSCNFICFGFIMRTWQTDTHRQMRKRGYERFTPATVVGVSKDRYTL